MANEKLVELIRDGRYKAEAICNKNNDCQTCTISNPDGYCKYGCIADHLIANGVTVQEQNGCEHCRTASYTENPFTVITQTGREVKTQFNFCPNCGRRLPQPPKGE